MNVEIADILAKIPKLPADYADRVHLGDIVAHTQLAEIESFGDHPAPRTYDASIKRGAKEGELSVTCNCPARTLCKHIVAFYAVAKANEAAVIAAVAQIAPQSTEKAASEPEAAGGEVDPRTEGLRLIALAEENYERARSHMLAGLALLRRDES